MNDNAGVVYEFGRFRLDVSEQRLLRDGEPVPLPPKVLDTLKMLVTHGGHVLGKDELMAAVWRDTFVEESSLTRNISLLRKALREEAGEKYIETVPKRGYRFVAPVRAVEACAPDVKAGQNGGGNHLAVTPSGPNGSQPSATSAGRVSAVTHGRRRLLTSLLLVLILAAAGGYVWSAKQRRTANPILAGGRPITSLAVLPFKVMGGDQESESLGLGMADAIILRLGNGGGCRVRPTGAVSKYASAEIDTLKAGKELAVDAVLDGTVQRVGKRVRVTVMLWNLKDGSPVWSGKFDEPFGDIFALQDSVSAQVADQLQLRLDVETPGRKRLFTANVEAYRYYTMGYYFWSRRGRENLSKAIQYFRQAIREDENYALAYSGLADAYLLDAYYDYQNLPLQEAYERAKEAAQSALRLDDTLPEANVASGMVSEFEGDLKAAERAFLRAIELDSSSTTARLRYAHLLASTSRLEQAISELQIAGENDPASSTLCQALGDYLLLARRYDESIKYSRLALELDPQSYAARENVAWAYAGKAMYAEADAEFDALAHSPASCQYGHAGAAYVSARRGLLKEARQLLAQTMKQVETGSGFPNSPLQVAKVLSLLGERDEAFAWIRRAVETGRIQPYQLEYGGELDALKNDPRFEQMIERVRNAKPPVKGIG